MRFAVRTLRTIVAVMLLAATSVFLTNTAAGQSAATPEAGPPASATPSAGTGSAPPTDRAAEAPAGAAPAAGSAAPGADASPQELLDRGEAALKTGDYPTALAAFSAAKTAALSMPGEAGFKARSMAMIGHGRALVGLKNYNAAIKGDFDPLIFDDPTMAPAYIERGKAKLEGGNPEGALRDFEKGLAQDSANVEGQFQYGKTLELLGHPEEAITPLTTAIAADPKNGEAYRSRGSAYLSLGKYKQATDDLQKAIELNPDDYESYFNLGIMYLRQEDFQASTDFFGKAIEHYKPKTGDDEMPFLQGMLLRSSTFLDLGKKLTDPAKKKAAFQAAIADAQKVVAQLDEKNILHKKPLADALVKQAMAERHLGEYGPAIRAFTKAVDLHASLPGDEATNKFLNDIYFRRGVCYLMINEEQMAISDFQSAAHFVDDDPRSSLWEGFCHAKLGNYHEALRAYGAAIAASDRYTPAYYNRALTYMMLGEYRKAIQDFNDAIRLDPTNAEFYFKRGIAYQQVGDHKKASESFASAIEFDKLHAGAYRHMSDVMQRLGRTELATQYSQKANQLATPQKKTQ